MLFFLILGAAGIAVGYPLDTVKVRIQTQDPTKGLKYTGTFQCISSIFKEEGVSQILFFINIYIFTTNVGLS